MSMHRTWSLLLFIPLLGCGKRATVDPQGHGLSRLESSVGLRLSDADPEKPPARTHVVGEALSDAETAALLARLPAPDADAGVAAAAEDGGIAMVLRDSSEPPPRPGTTVKDSFPPPASARTAPEVTAGPLTVTRSAPEGDVSHAPNVSITFSQPMVPVTTHSAVAQIVPARITPLPAGEFRWLGTQTLVFQPTKEFPKSTEYTVEVEGAKSVSGVAMEGSHKLTFRTPTVKVVTFVPQGSSVETNPMLFFELDQRVDPAQVLEHVKLEGASKAIAVRLATRAEIDAAQGLRARLKEIERKGEGRVLMLKPVEPLPVNEGFDVTLEAGTPSLEGPRTTESSQRYSFRTYEPLALEGQNCGTGDFCTAESTFALTFNNDLDARSFRPEWVRIEPELSDRKVYVQGRSLMIWGRWRSSKAYRVTVSKELRDKFGQQLYADLERSPSLNPLSPQILRDRELSVVDPATLRSAGGAPEVRVQSINIKRLRVRLFRVTPEQWYAYQAYRERWGEAIGERKPTPPPPWTAQVDREISVPAEVDDIAESALDLSPVLEGDTGHVILLAESLDVRSESRNYYRSWMDQDQLRWMQVTHIGLSVFEDNRGRLDLFASQLADAKPIEGVQFSLIGTAFNAAGDATGKAHMGPIPARGDDKHYVVVARKGKDSIFEPSINGDSGRWPADLTLHTFDDRGLYKPGETVRVKGIVRKVGNERGGDVRWDPALTGQSVQYTVHDPRGAQLTKGKVTLDDAGGFELSFALKDNVNLGDAQVSFTYRDDHLQQHRFRIAEFRKPEYEVRASVEDKPFIVGDFGVATAHASYYAGGELRAAETRWRVTRNETSYSPPGRADYLFGNRARADYWWHRVEPYAQANTAEWQGRTDAQGDHRMRVDFLDNGSPYPAQLSIEATVTDQSHQAWNSTTSMLLHPAALYAGVRLDKPFVHAGDPISLDVVATGIDGAFVGGRSVRVRSWRSEREQVQGEWIIKDADEQTCTVTSKDGAFPKACALPTSKAGLYGVVAEVTDDQGRVSRTLLSVWVTGAKDEPGSVRASRLELDLDKQRYAPGDHAELLIKAPFAPAQAIVQIVGGAAPREQRLTLESTTQSVDLPILPTDVPGLQVRVLLLGSEPRLDLHGEPVNDVPPRPAFATAMISIDVPPADRNLEVKLTPREPKVLPGGKTRVAIDIDAAKTGAQGVREAAVFMVDESVLMLAGYTLADPKSAFYKQIGLLPYLRESRASVALATIDKLRERFRVPVPTNYQQPPSSPWGSDAPGNMWGDSLGDSFGAGGLGLSGVGFGGGGRGDGIGLGTIGTIGHGAGSGAGQGYGSGRMPSRAAPKPAPSVRQSMDFAKEKSESAMARPSAAPTADKGGALEQGCPAGDPLCDTGTDTSVAIALRKNFEALALWHARVLTDANGHAELDVDMPDSTTRYRLMAVAWDHGGAFGVGESAITAQLPLMVRPSAPRFLNYGDHFDLPIVVQNQADHPVEVQLAARTANATLDHAQGRRFSIAAGDRVEVRLPSAAGLPGRAAFDFAVAARGEDIEHTDAAHVEMPVWTPGTTEAFATYGTLDEAEDGAIGQAVQIPADVDPKWGALDISTSSTALFALSDALLNLRRYPYECNEQLASRVLGVGTLRDMMRAFAANDVPSPEALRASVIADLERLAKRQHGNGGFGFWDRNGSQSPYVSIHVAFALSVAKKKGYPVPDTLYYHSLDYLRGIESYLPERLYSRGLRDDLRAYAVFVRDRLGESDPAEAARLISDPIEKISLERLAWLLPTLAKDPTRAELKQKILRHFSNRVSETAGAAHFTTDYGEEGYLMLASNHRTDALILNALVEVDPHNDLLPKIVAGLLGAKKQGRWQNTQEDAFVLLALDAYFHKFESLTPNFSADTWLGDKLASAHRFVGRNTDRVETSVPMSLLSQLGQSQLVVAKKGKGRLYYRLGLRYAPSDLVLPPIDRGFVVERRYESVGEPTDVRRDENGVWRVKLGALVRVRLDMAATSERHHVALVDPMPAGFEAQNTALGGVPSIDPRVDDDAPFRGWWWRWYEHENLRDERAEAFTSLLRAGAHTYEYVTRATVPGNFVVPPSKAEEMYSPETFGRSAGDRVIIE